MVRRAAGGGITSSSSSRHVCMEVTNIPSEFWGRKRMPVSGNGSVTFRHTGLPSLLHQRRWSAWIFLAACSASCASFKRPVFL